MAYTQSDIDNLDAQYKLGARRFRFQDRDYELQTVDDYIKLRSMMTNEVAQQSGRAADPASAHRDFERLGPLDSSCQLRLS